MVSLADSMVSSSSRVLPLRMRPDLSARLQRYQGQPYWVVKEPIGLKYYRFQEEEFFILRMLDGAHSFEMIKEEFEAEFPPQKITLGDLQSFIGMLHRSGLLVADAQGQGKQLRKRRDESVQRELMGKVSNILALRFKGIDPERLLNFLLPYFGWIFRKYTVMCCLLVALSALMLIAVQFDTFRASLPAFHEFFGPRNWIWLGVVLGTTKVLHEFGHGLSCKYFGGECHEMGVMFLVLTPCLYCNVSDSWLLPNKWHRAAIGAAGMYVEVWLASIATFLWWFSEPGLLNHICLNVMFICSVSTILFNGNPLLRFDGYYILSDIAEIPNLRQKASKILNHWMAEWCLGMELPEDPFLPERGKAFFCLYTVAAVVYRWFVVFSIMIFLNKVLEPYGLKILGQMVAVMGIVGMFVQPIRQLWKFFSVPGRFHEVKAKNLTITGVVLASFFGVLFLVPMPHRVRCSVEIAPRDAASVYVEVPGKLVKVVKQIGEEVSEGDLLFELENTDLDVDIESLRGQIKQLASQIRFRERESFRNPNSLQQLPELKEALMSSEKLFEEKLEEKARLTIKAPEQGEIISPPVRPDPKESQLDGRLPTWSGTPFESKNQGMHMQISDLLCQVGDSKNLDARLIIDQRYIDFVRTGQTVWVRLDAYPEKTFETAIEVISHDEIDATSAAMSNQAGGELATRTDSGGKHRLLSTSYPAKAPLRDEEELLRVGLRGRGKILVDPEPWGVRLFRFFAHTFHFEI